MNSRVSTLRVALSATALAGLLALSACGGSSKTSGTPAPSATSASASTTPGAGASSAGSASASASASVKKNKVTSLDAVSVTGPFGKMPTVKAPYPFEIDKTQSKVLVQGKGAEVTKTSMITFNYQGIDATTGKSFDSSWNKGRSPLSAPATGLIPGFTTSIVGKHVGDRVLMVINSKDGYDSAGGQGDIKVGDTLIFVVDITGTSLTGVTGTEVKPAAGLPTVGKDAQGYPTVSIDSSKAAPKSIVVQPLMTGTGAVVKATDQVQVHYRAYSWKTGKLVLSDYEGNPEVGAVSQLLQSWQKGLVGKKVGSRTMIIAPNAYPNGNATPSVAAGDTLVFVIDVLYATPAQS